MFFKRRMVMKLTVTFLSLALFSLLFIGLSGAMAQGICPPDGEVIAGSLDSASGPFQDGRVFRDGLASTCAAPKAFPGPISIGTQNNYETHTFTAVPADTCVTVNFDVGTCGTGVFAVAYINSYNPANLGQNYLADLGASLTQSFSFVVPTGNQLVLVATSVSGSATCSYSFSVDDYPCQSFLSISLAPDSATLHSGESHTVTATVESQGDPFEGALVTFEVNSGPNAGRTSVPGSGECSPNDNCTTDANGQVSWTYSSNAPGTDVITASILDGGQTELSNPVEVTWEGYPIPTLSQWGLIAMAVLSGIIGIAVLRKRKAAA